MQKANSKKPAEEILNNLDLVFDNLNDGAILINIKGTILAVNKALLSLGGYRREEILGKNAMKLARIFPPASLKKMFTSFLDATKGIPGDRYEIVAKTSTGEKKVIELSNAVIRKNGKIIGIAVTVRDNTSRLALENKSNIIYENAPDAYYICDLAGTFVDGNKKAEELTGYKRQELIGKNFLKLNLLPKDQILIAAKLLIKSASGHKTGPDILVLQNKNGSKVDVEIVTHPVVINNKRLILGIARDITKRKEVENIIVKQREEQQIIIDSVPAWIFYKDKENRFIRVNKAFCEVMKLSREQLEGKAISDFYPKDQAEAFWRDDKEVIKSGKAKRNIIESMDSPQGLRWLRTDKIPYYDAAGKIIGIIGFTVDITEQRKIENDIKEAGQFLSSIINTVSDPIFVKDDKHCWVIVNDALCKFIGQPREKLIGKSDYDFFPKKEADIFWQKDEEVFQKGKENINEENFTDAKGKTHVIITKKNLYISSQGIKFLVGTIQDITESKIAAQTIKESEEKFRNLFESSQDAIVILEPPTWKFVSGNQAAIKMFVAKNEKEFTTLGPWDISPKIQPDGQLSDIKSKMMIEKAMKEGSNFFEWVHRKLNGNEFPATILLAKTKIGKKIVLQATIRDISLQKSAEKALREKMDELEKINQLMVGRELKMVELKEKIKQLEAGNQLPKQRQSWADRFQTAVDLEESMIQSLGSNYFSEIDNFNLGIIQKIKIKKLIQTLINDSARHKRLFKELIDYENSKR